MTPERIGPAGFVDAAPHRQALAPAYNRYVRCAADPAWTPALEPAQMVLQPLFITAFLLDQYLRDPANGYEGADILVTSASSKTAIAMAWCLGAAGRTGVHALTSPRNADFVAGLDLYGGVTTYDALDTLDTARPALVVDFAGDAGLNRDLHTRYDGALLASVRVGGAHWENSAPPDDLPPPRPHFFFAPDAAQALARDWGQAEFEQRYKSAWAGFADAAGSYFDFRSQDGAGGAKAVYDALIAGEVPARDALTITV